MDMLEGLAVTGHRHLRGLHYILVGGAVTKPNGLPYTNTDNRLDLAGQGGQCGM